MDRLMRCLAGTRPRHVFLIFLAIYLATWGGHYTSGDGAEKVAWAKALVLRGSHDLDPGPEVRYSKFGVGHTLLAVPPIALAHLIKAHLGVPCEAALYTLLFVFNGAFFVYLVAVYLWPLYGPHKAWATVLLIGLATTWWPHSKLDFSEVLVTTTVFWGFLCLRRNQPFRGMLLAGLASTFRQDAVLLTMLLALWHLWRTGAWRDAPRLALGCLPAGLLHAAANAARYGSLLGHGYGEAIRPNFPLFAGLYGLWFSAGKSVFLFSPPLLLGFAAWRRFRASAHGRTDAVLFLAAFVVQGLFYAHFAFWPGDDAWGPRYLIPGAMLMCVPLVELADRRGWVVGLALIGVLVQLLAVLVSGLEFCVLLRQHTLLRQGIYGFTDQNRIDMEDMRYHPRYNQLVGHWTLIRARLGCPPAPKPPAHTRDAGVSLYEALPADVWRQGGWDFIWLRSRRPAAPQAVPAPSPAPAAPAHGSAIPPG